MLEELIARYLLPISIAAGTTLALLLVRAVSLRLLHRWAARTASTADDIVLAALRRPSIFWCVAIGLHVGLALSEIPDKYLLSLLRTIRVLVTFSITLSASTIVGKLVGRTLQSTDVAVPATGLMYGVIKGTVVAIGLVIMLSQLGIAVAPLLTALGVGGLAVALALQDTLANLFAGMHILLEKSVRVGDTLRLESGQEGTVHDITWRTTRIHTLQNNVVVIPNSKLAQSVVTNYALPEPRLTLQLPVAVDYASDPRRVQLVLVDVARRAAGTVPGLLAEPAPSARFAPGFGPSGLEFTLNVAVAAFTDQIAVQSELRALILERFRAEGIAFPPVPGTLLSRGPAVRPA